MWLVYVLLASLGLGAGAAMQKHGNLLTDDMETIRRRLLELQATSDCVGCWTSCRGTVETLMYTGQRVRNLVDFHGLTRRLPLSRPSEQHAAG